MWKQKGNDSKRRIWDGGNRKTMTVNGEHGRVEAGTAVKGENGSEEALKQLLC